MNHIPIMVKEVIDYLVTKKDGIYLDCTLCLGGHASKILEATFPYGHLIGIEIDSQVITLARENLKKYGDRVSIINGNYADLVNILNQQKISQVDGVLMDLGVSSIQLDTPKRGFSFRYPGPLDMRMSQDLDQPISYDLNNESADKLASIIQEFGEERWAKKIADNIVRVRKNAPITTTVQLAEIIEKTIPRTNENIHPATRTFQALRIYKNHELENLKKGLDQAISVLNYGSRICVISFHSLEDRIVKQTFRIREHGCICPPKIPKCICGKKPTLKIVTKRPIIPCDEEIESNPRSRSAKLRVAEKI